MKHVEQLTSESVDNNCGTCQLTHNYRTGQTGIKCHRPSAERHGGAVHRGKQQKVDWVRFVSSAAHDLRPRCLH